MKHALVRESSLILAFITRIIDIAMMIAAARYSYHIYFDQWGVPQDYRIMYGLVTFSILAVFPQFALYQSWRGMSKAVEVQRVFYAISTIFILLTLIVYLTQTESAYPRGWFVLWYLYSLTLIALSRIVIRYAANGIRTLGFNQKQVVVFGENDALEKVRATLQSNQWLGLDIVNTFTLSSDESEITSLVAEMIDYVGEHSVQEVWVSLPLSQAGKLEFILNELSIVPLTVRYIPDIFGLDLINHSVSELANMPVVNVSMSPMEGWNRILKWLEDKILAAIILILISPLLLVIAVGVKLSSPGPILYRQERLSWNGRRFDMYKFRSMAIGHEQSQVKWGNATKKPVTRFGKFLRATSLDELPQFINVLKGDMSIVGPRPERTVFVNQFKQEIPRYMQKHKVKAGITGWAQINGWRGDTDLTKRIEYDIYYIEHWSLALDLKIIILTFVKGFIHRNAK